MSVTDAQLTQMRAKYTHTLPDVAAYVTNTFTQDDSYGTVKTTSVSSDFACGFEFSPFKFRAREAGVVGEQQSEILSRVRVRRTDFDALAMDRTGIIRLKRRFDTLVNPVEDYEIQGFAEIGPVGVILNVQRVEL